MVNYIFQNATILCCEFSKKLFTIHRISNDRRHSPVLYYSALNIREKENYARYRYTFIPKIPHDEY